MILGMHRSGTSAFGGSMARLGVDFGERLARPAKDNEKGFWEHVEIVALHDQLLASLRSSWDSDAPLPADWLERDRSREIQMALARIVARDFGDRKLFGFKDPRISRLLPLWFPIFEQLNVEAHFVLMVRHPWEVSESLLRRNGIVPSKAMLLWLRYTLEAEQATRDKPRSVVSYAELLSDPGGVLARVWQDLDLPQRAASSAEEAVAEFLEGSLRHHRADAAERRSHSAIPRVVLQTYDALLASAGSPAATKRISALVEQLDLYSALFQPRIDYLSDGSGGPAAGEAATRYVQLQEDFEEKVKHVAILQAELDERTRQIAEARSAFEEKVTHVAILRAELDERTQQVIDARAAFDEKVKHLGIAEGELETRTLQLARLQEAFDEKSRHVSILQREVQEHATKSAEQIAALQREVEATAAQFVTAKEQSAEEARVSERLRQELQLTQDRLTRVSAELIELRWDDLTVRANAIRGAQPLESQAAAIMEWENRAQIAEKQCDHLREMLQALQTDMEEQQAARVAVESKLKLMRKELRFQQKQMARLREITSRKLILPFGKAQRRIRQLTATTRADD